MSQAALDIPRRLNDSPRFFWWEMDVALIFMSGLLAGLLSGFLLSGGLLGAALATGFGKAKSGQHPAFVHHLLYWHLPPFVSGLQRTPPSYLRMLQG